MCSTPVTQCIYSLLCSGYGYTNRALQYALGLPAHSSDWRQLFDVVVCAARKPDFYKSRLPFRQLNISTGSPTTAPVSSLARGGVYIQGSARALLEATRWRGMYGDDAI